MTHIGSITRSFSGQSIIGGISVKLVQLLFFILMTTAFQTCAFIQTCRAADQPEARAIMQKVDAREDGDNATLNMQMTLIDKNGSARIREIKSFSKDKGKDTLRLMFFMHPAQIKNTGFLTHDYDDHLKDDDQWLYLPALGKSKRISSNDRSGSFMGSDISYADLTSLNLEDFDFTIIKETEVSSKPCWVIQAIPRSKKVIDETGYTKSVFIVRKDNDLVIREIHWLNEGGYVKYIDAKKVEKIDGIWIRTELKVLKTYNNDTVHTTVLKLSNVKFNQKLDYTLFTVRSLEKGYIVQ